MKNNFTTETLTCLNTWPVGSVGYNEEKKVIAELFALGERHGFGRISQLASQIEIILQDPEKVAEFETVKKNHAKLMDQCVKPI